MSERFIAAFRVLPDYLAQHVFLSAMAPDARSLDRPSPGRSGGAECALALAAACDVQLDPDHTGSGPPGAVLSAVARAFGNDPGSIRPVILRAGISSLSSRADALLDVADPAQRGGRADRNRRELARSRRRRRHDVAGAVADCGIAIGCSGHNGGYPYGAVWTIGRRPYRHRSARPALATTSFPDCRPRTGSMCCLAASAPRCWLCLPTNYLVWWRRGSRGAMSVDRVLALQVCCWELPSR